jgi:hypothetical protein
MMIAHRMTAHRRSAHRLLAGFLIIRVGDLNDVQRVIEIRGGSLPFGGIQGEDRADRYIRNSGDVRIPGIKTSSSDQVSQPGGLLSTAQRGNGDDLKEFQASQQVVTFLAAGVK